MVISGAESADAVEYGVTAYENTHLQIRKLTFLIKKFISTGTKNMLQRF
jgi:hypothetical protein